MRLPSGDHLQLVGIEPLAHQRLPAPEQQKAWWSVDRIRIGIYEELSLL
jgi:hypothetical protein